MSLLQKPIVRTALVAAALFAVTYAIAATLGISGVDYLAGGEADVYAGKQVVDVSWILTRQGNKWMVTDVRITFESALPGGAFVGVELYGTGNDPIATGSTTLLDSAAQVIVPLEEPVLPKDVKKIAIAVSIPDQ